MEMENKLKVHYDNLINDLEIDIDIEDGVMSKIMLPKKRIIQKKILVFAAVISILIISTGLVFGAEIRKLFKENDFMNDKGEVEWSLKTEDEDLTFNERADEVYKTLDLAEGEAVAIYVVNDNPNNSIVCMQEPSTINDNELMNTFHIGLLDITIENEILQKYQFENGVVSYQILGDNLYYGDFKEEASETGSEFIVKEIEVSTDISSISWDYFENGEITDQPAVSVLIGEWKGNEIIQFEDEFDVTKGSESIMIAGSEVLYEYRTDFKQITWLSGECLFRIHSYNLDMTKEELIQIAEQIKLRNCN
jgi:hypothetical protein